MPVFRKMNRQLHSLTNEKFMEGIFICTGLRAVGYHIFMRWMSSDCFKVPEWNSVVETCE